MMKDDYFRQHPEIPEDSRRVLEQLKPDDFMRVLLIQWILRADVTPGITTAVFWRADSIPALTTNPRIVRHNKGVRVTVIYPDWASELFLNVRGSVPGVYSFGFVPVTDGTLILRYDHPDTQRAEGADATTCKGEGNDMMKDDYLKRHPKMNAVSKRSLVRLKDGDFSTVLMIQRVLCGDATPGITTAVFWRGDSIPALTRSRPIWQDSGMRVTATYHGRESELFLDMRGATPRVRSFGFIPVTGGTLILRHDHLEGGAAYGYEAEYSNNWTGAVQK